VLRKRRGWRMAGAGKGKEAEVWLGIGRFSQKLFFSKKNFPNLNKGWDIRLGAVVASQPDGTQGGVV
jgi:hypothetical protein